MKVSKSQLKNIIKEELESVLGEERTTDRFQDMIKAQFRLAKNRATVENMARYYDEMIASASDNAPFGAAGSLEIADELGLNRENPYWGWVKHHLSYLNGLPREIIDALPPSAAFAPAAMDRIEKREKQEAEREDIPPMSPEKFGAKMHRGDYGRLD